MRYYTRGSAVLVGVALTVTVTLTACGGTASGGGPTAPNNGSVSVSVNPTFNDVDAMFVRMMIPHHEQAVEMAALAEMKATDPDVRQLAAKINTGQKAEIATMKGWLAQLGPADDDAELSRDALHAEQHDAEWNIAEWHDAQWDADDAGHDAGHDVQRGHGKAESGDRHRFRQAVSPDDDRSPPGSDHDGSGGVGPWSQPGRQGSCRPYRERRSRPRSLRCGRWPAVAFMNALRVQDAAPLPALEHRGVAIAVGTGPALGQDRSPGC